MKILNAHHLIQLLSRYSAAINDAPYLPELYEKAEELRIEIEKEICGGACKDLQSAIEALQADAARMREALEKIAAQHSGEVASRKLSDCMAAIASLALRNNGT